MDIYCIRIFFISSFHMFFKIKVLRYIFFFFLFFGSHLYLHAQTGFNLPAKTKSDIISFELINNLPIIPVEVNGAKLSFILDTGVKSTIIFSLYNTDSLQINNTTPIHLQGLGAGGTVEAIKSEKNIVTVGAAIDLNHTLYVIFDESLNFSPRMGVPIHGILGSDFFQNFIVKINYASERITIYNREYYLKKKCKSCENFVLSFYEGKPFMKVETASKNGSGNNLVLIDSGSSDALWLFDENDFIVENPKNYFDDFLGLGLSGHIFGKRARIPEAHLGKFNLKNVNVAFPEQSSIQSALVNKERDGSIGGDLLKRFTVEMDYKDKWLRLKKNKHFSEPFTYNMSGLTLEHNGMDLVREENRKGDNNKTNANNRDSETSSSTPIFSATTYIQFKLVPNYIVAELRENSPAALAGIEIGDRVIKVNGKFAYNYTLNELIDFFSKEEGKSISLNIERAGRKLKYSFYLEKLL